MRISDWSSDVCSSDLTLAGRTPDFQTAIGYPAAPPGRANLSMSTAQLAPRYGAVSMTLEMPFKDNADLPDPHFGWYPARSMPLARDCLGGLAVIMYVLYRRCPDCGGCEKSVRQDKKEHG